MLTIPGSHYGKKMVTLYQGDVFIDPAWMIRIWKKPTDDVPTQSDGAEAVLALARFAGTQEKCDYWCMKNVG